MIIGGDFNGKVGIRNRLGKYALGELNENDELLLEFAKMNDLKITNTFFKHKPSHLTTWECPERTNGNLDAKTQTVRRNPYRNQIDFILIRKSPSLLVTNSRAYNGIRTKSDHKIVIMDVRIKWRIAGNRNKAVKKIDVAKLQIEEYRQEYEQTLSAKLAEIPRNNSNQVAWNDITEAINGTATEILGYVAKKASNDEIKVLSELQKKVHDDINSTDDPDKRKELRTERNRLLTQIHNILKRQENSKIESALKPLIEAPNDSRKMFEAVKYIQKLTPPQPLIVNTDSGLTANEEQQSGIIADFFKEQFFRNAKPLPDIPPTPMRIPFTADEIKKAASKLKNNKSPGCDGIVAEMIKCAPDEIFERISTIYNNMSREGDFPEEVILGVLRALQKPGKSKGPVQHLRPIILLSILRKILAICLTNRIGDRIDQKIPLSQAAYRKGRSTTEHVFAVKAVIERTITSKSERAYLTLHDMSKAFDTIDRRALIEDLSDVIEQDELHLVKNLLDVKLSVRCGNFQSETFKTDTGAPQGDCMSANEFTFYLAKTLYDTEFDQQIDVQANQLLLDLEYADDITHITTDGKKSQSKKENLPNKLSKRNLTENKDKTEEYVIDKMNNEWRKCKLLGSLLDTEADIKRRQGLAIDVMKKLKFIMTNSKISLKSKLLAFNAYVAPIFLYNSELWTLNKKRENQVDVFQRKLIKYNVLHVFYPKVISNDELYQLTNCLPWSDVIRKRRLKWFGHLMRLPDGTPAKKALAYADEKYQRPRGRPVSTWLALLKKQLFNDHGLVWNEACQLANDRDAWKRYT